MANQPISNGIDAVGTAGIAAEKFAAITGAGSDFAIGFELQDTYGADFSIITRAGVINKKDDR